MTSQCAVCGEAARPQDPLIPDEFYPDESLHLLCLNSPGGRRWHETRYARDPGYKRYFDLITAGRQITCPSCGSNENHMWPKGTGHSPKFQLCCTECDEIDRAGISPYGESILYSRLSDVRQDFVLGRNLDAIEPRVTELSHEYAGKFGGPHRGCGGEFTIVAKPRCHQCRSIVEDTFFHYNDLAPRYPQS